MMDNFLKVNGQARLIFFYQEPEVQADTAGSASYIHSPPPSVCVRHTS